MKKLLPILLALMAALSLAACRDNAMTRREDLTEDGMVDRNDSENGVIGDVWEDVTEPANNDGAVTDNGAYRDTTDNTVNQNGAVNGATDNGTVTNGTTDNGTSRFVGRTGTNGNGAVNDGRTAAGRVNAIGGIRRPLR